jgi:hypothetical protein
MRVSVASAFVACLVLAACVVHSGPPDTSPAVEVHDHTPPSGPQPVPPAAGAKVADGGACLFAAECASDICEGQGCSNDEPGRCGSRARMCTQDVETFCGCDGRTFQGSGSCPRVRFASKGACPEGAPPAGGGGKLADGTACASADECNSGVCEGQGCTQAQLGKCVARVRPCTRDLRTFCSCKGVTFQGSSSCPGQRYSVAGSCAAVK